jgi:chromosomal replication initiator protein
VPLHIADIQRRVAEHFGISTDELLSSRRRPARPRQVAYYLCRELTPSSLPQIGRAFARDHTTILSGIIQVERRLRSDPALAREVWALLSELRASMTENISVDVGDSGDSSG